VSQQDIDLPALLAGDRDEFDKIVRNEAPRLFKVLIRYVRDEDEAKSIMQETFLQAYEGLDTFRGDSKFTTWLYSIGINQARARFRKLKRQDLLSEDEIDRLQPSFSLGRYNQSYEPWQPDEVASKSERQRLVHEAILKLPENYRVVVELRDIEEFSTDETAEMLEMTSGAVRVRLHRARQALRALLEPYFSNPA
jgi:RNA polymerase sigma-70 factor (ECF subfamily)